jgi:uncharacterized membrane protein
VVLFICHKKTEDAMQSAEAVFARLKLAQTQQANSVLLFVAPESQRLAVMGGAALYTALPPEWWAGLIASITTRFAEGKLTEGLLAALQEIGDTLRHYFPVDRAVDRGGQSNLLEES